MTSSQGDFAQALAGQAQQQTVQVNSQVTAAALKHVQNAGTQVDASIRSSLNLIAGTGVTLAFADDSANDRVSVTASVSQPGLQLDYAQITSPVTIPISAVSEATAQTVVSGNSISYSGARVRVELFCPEMSGASAFTLIILRDSTVLGQFPISSTSATFSAPPTIFDTPSAGSHTYSAAVFISSGTNAGTFSAGNGGAGHVAPAFIVVNLA